MFYGVRPPVGDVGVSGEGVADPYNVGAVSIERTVGVISDSQAVDSGATFELEGAVILIKL
jgi:hypothetical protein